MLINSPDLSKLHMRNKWHLFIVELFVIITIIVFVFHINPLAKGIFVQEVTISELIPNNLKHALRNDKWILDTEINQQNTMLKIPDYFRNKRVIKPPKAPFDPRFTLAFYYDFILNNVNSIEPLELPFHWADWTDMEPLDPYFVAINKTNKSCAALDMREFRSESFPYPFETGQYWGAKDPKDFCNDVPVSENGLGFEVHSFPGRMTEQLAATAGKAYLFSLAPNPLSILFLTGNGSYHFPVSSSKNSLLDSTIVPEYLTRNKNPTHINLLERFQSLQKYVLPTQAYFSGTKDIEISPEDFTLDPLQDLLDLEARQQEKPLSPQEKMYMDAIVESMEKEDYPYKYFTEAQVFDTTICDHYDWRFFNGFKYRTKDSSLIMARVMRTWLSFTRKQGLNTWLAHGSLLSWHLNGLNFPWDYDGDVQMPIQDLKYLSLKFNQSLIVENGEEGFSRYFVDCGTFITSRGHTNGENNIDARFIDVDSGFYIDITGLAVSSDIPPDSFKDQLDSMPAEMPQKEKNAALHIYNCRNYHFANLTEISPLKKTNFEGEIAYVPNNFESILFREYNKENFLNHRFDGFYFLPQLRLWIPIERILMYLRNREKWILVFGPEREKTRKKTEFIIEGDLTEGERKTMEQFSSTELEELLYDEDILFYYLLTMKLTQYHQEEMGGNVTNVRTSNHEPVSYEPHMYKMKVTKQSFEQRVATFMRQYHASRTTPWRFF